MNYEITQEIRDWVNKLRSEGKDKTAVRKLMQDRLGWGKTKCYEALQSIGLGPVAITAIYNEPKIGISVGNVQGVERVTFQGELEIEDPVDDQIEVNDNYTYNKLSDHYIVTCKKTRCGYIVKSGSVVRAIRAAYVAGSTASDIAGEYSIPKDCVNEFLQRLNITHDGSTFTDEELKVKNNDQLVAEALEKRKFDLEQRIEKETWKNIQSDAIRWNEFKYNTLQPFDAFLKSWTPPKYTPVSLVAPPTSGNRTFVVGAFDWHFGALAESRYLYRGRDWNIEEANKSIDKFTAGIAKKVASDKVGFNKCVFLLGGDLYNTLTGFTSNGTMLNNEVIKDTQFESIMNALIKFINRLLELFPEVECHFVRGNHGGTTDIPLAWAVKNYYRTEKRVSFDISSCRTKAIKVNSVLMLMDHGASDQTKAQVPINGKARESYVQSLFLAHPEMLVGIKQKVFVMGDLHHYQQHEYSDFEFIMFGGMPAGDQYSDAKNLHNRPRQNCLIIDDEGIESVVHVYLD